MSLAGALVTSLVTPLAVATVRPLFAAVLYLPPMELSDAVRERRMVRSFSSTPIPTTVLDRILELACTAPSAGNTGGWDAVVLAGPDQTERFWEATTTADWRMGSRRWPGMSRAPVVVALFVHAEAYLERYRRPDKRSSDLGHEEDAWPVPYWFVDGGFAALLLLLAATDAGLGACFLGNFRGEANLRVALGVPDSRRYIGAVVMGTPDGADTPSSW
ncbi:MAG TPA: nitroreductase family protein, partial [Acidimicrobiales bacterium]|nr:nitroreductase family protein [Acidimicrobiales bacterium]